MKKLTALMVLLCSVLSVFATDYETESNVAYLKDCNLQVGTDGTIDLYLKSERPIGTVHVIMDMPEGVTINSVVSNGAAVTFNEKENNLLLGKGEPYYSTGKIATLNVTVAADAQLGYQTMTIKEQTIVEPDLTTYILYGVNSELTIQKSAVIKEMPEGYGFAIIPFTLAANEKKDITVYMKNALDVTDMNITVNLPEGISNQYTISSRGAKTYTSATLDKSNLYSSTHPECPALVLKQEIANNGSKINYTLDNESGDSFLPTDEYVPAFTIPVVGSSSLAEGVYNLSISLSSIHACEDFSTWKGYEYHGGEYLASVIVGQPAQEEAILYGHFTSDAASTFTTALKNVAIADVTAATVDEGVKFTDVLVNEKGGNSYYTRTSVNYGTTVLPLDLTTENTDKLYKIESMDSEGIIIEETDVVAANTPCIFKGTINAEGATPTLGVPSEQGLGQTTFKGTYEATSIAEGEGYYIASNGKFYNDGASIRPFRGYFDGAVVGAKSFTVILDDATGLIDITDQFSKEDIYNLQGIRMNNVQKGINIKGGKKVLVK